MTDNNLHDRLFAEAEAWPLLSHKAFELRVVRLGWTRPGVLEPHTEQVARELEEHLRYRAQGESLARLRALRERAWFGEKWSAPASIPLHEYLCRLADHHLEPGGAQVRLRELAPRAAASPWARAMHWRWLSLRIPPDLLVAALHASQGTAPTTDRISLVTPHLREVLSSPVAETHLHEKAAFSFSVLWTSWMAWLLRDGPVLEHADPTDTWPFGSPERFLLMLQAAAITRFMLVGYLERHRPGQQLRFADICHTVIERALEHNGRQTGRSERWLAFNQALRLIYGGTVDGAEPAMLRRVYRLLTGSRSSRKPQSVEDIIRQDPIEPWNKAREALPETVFAARAMCALREGAGEDFACFFWQYQRIRCQVYTFLTLEPGTSGLDWFQRAFDRLRLLRGDLDQILTDAAVRLEGADLNLGSLELRRSPKQNWAQVANDLGKLARDVQAPGSKRKSNELEVGIVFHFLKESHRGKGKGLHADPAADGYGVRFGDWTIARRREAEALCTVLRRYPESLVFFRGVDIAGAELTTPTWPFVGLLRRVRDASISAAHGLARPEIPPLRVTCHAGEEYRRLVEGLRRIHELVEGGVVRSGDRIGHGLALGADPKLHPRCVEQPLEDRIEDLLWELERYRCGDIEDRWGRTQRISSELRDLIEEVYRVPSVDLDVYMRFRRLLLAPGSLERIGFPRHVDPPRDEILRQPEEVARSYLKSPEVFMRGQRPVTVDLTEGEEGFLLEAQRWLRRLLARLEVSVECNPSSNLLIGHLGSMEQHPVRTLTMGPKDGVSADPLMVSINTDDPITFATCLADEYAHLYLALLRQGLPAEEALGWVDRVRRAGWRSRFTLRASTEPMWLNAARRWRTPPKLDSDESPFLLEADDVDDEETDTPEPAKVVVKTPIFGLMGWPWNSSAVLNFSWLW